MINWLKHHFVPHEGNGHRPHLLRGENARWFVVAVLGAECLIFLLPTLSILNVGSQMGAVIEAILDQGTNQNRQEQALPPLAISPLLNQSAQLKAEDMATNAYFAHVSPTGKTPWYWFKQVGYQYSYAGENLAINFTDSTDVTNAWMNSPTHRANILDAHYTEMGTGIATGTYDGRETIFIAQEFATPAPHVDATPVAVASTVSASPSTATTTARASTASTSPSTSPEVLGTTATPPPSISLSAGAAVAITPSLLQKILASPRHTTNIILFSLLMIVVTALSVLMLKVNVRHPDLITNGLLVIALIFGVCIVNGFLGNHGASLASNVYNSTDAVPQSTFEASGAQSS